MAIIFKCPATSFNVQYELDDDPDIPDTEFEVVTCPACTRLHFLNRNTGKLLGQDGGDRAEEGLTPQILPYSR